ncbi:MLO-like protein 8 [Bienertia sinuspersici]
MAEEDSNSLEHTSTWIVAVVCFIMVFLSLAAERGLHRLGKCLKRKEQESLFDALQKIKAELMLLGFISLLLTVFQGLISDMCIPKRAASFMLPCKTDGAGHEGNTNGKYAFQSSWSKRRLLAEDDNPCAQKGKAQFMSLEALHQLHIFIFVLAVVYVFFSAATMILGVLKNQLGSRKFMLGIAMSSLSNVEDIQLFWYLWVFVVLFLLLNLEVTPLINGAQYRVNVTPGGLRLLLIVGTKLEHIIICLADEIEEKDKENNQIQNKRESADKERPWVTPSDKHFWFGRPSIFLYLIHFILFQNSFEVAFFLWVLFTYGIRSCILDRIGFIVPRLVIGILVQVLCSYSTLPLYTIVTQMGSAFKHGIFETKIHELLDSWRTDATGHEGGHSSSNRVEMQILAPELREIISVADESVCSVEGFTAPQIAGHSN